MKAIFFLALLQASLVLADEAKPCIFCEIAAGTREAAVVYRDPTVIAFMTIGPRNPGHVLVVPVRHADNLLDLPASTARDLMAVAQKIAQAIKRTDLKADGIQLQMNAGKAAGQTVFHAHLHVIPRYIGEPEPPTEKDRPPLSELEAVAEKIRAKLE